MKDCLHLGHSFVLPTDLVLACKVLLQCGQGKVNVAGSSGGTVSTNADSFIVSIKAGFSFSISITVQVARFLLNLKEPQKFQANLSGV